MTTEIYTIGHTLSRHDALPIWHQPLLDAAVQWGSKTLDLNEHLIHQMVHDNSNAIVRFTGLDESIAKRIVKGLAKLLADMAAEPDHPIRLRVEEGMAKLALDLQENTEENGRAPCRERVSKYVSMSAVAVQLTKKQ